MLRKKPNTMLQDQIEDLHDQMKLMVPGTEEYNQHLTVLSELYKIEDKQKPDRVDANTKAVIAANLAGIALIINFERLHVVTSKALGFVIKTKM